MANLNTNIKQHTDVEVAITVRLGDQTKTFNAATTAPNGGHRVTNGLIHGLSGDATAWVRDQQFDATDH